MNLTVSKDVIIIFSYDKCVYSIKNIRKLTNCKFCSWSRNQNNLDLAAKIETLWEIIVKMYLYIISMYVYVSWHIRTDKYLEKYLAFDWQQGWVYVDSDSVVERIVSNVSLPRDNPFNNTSSVFVLSSCSL